MKTDDLVTLLATGAPAIDPRAVPKRFAWAVLAGGGGALALMGVLFGTRPDLFDAMGTWRFWMRLAVPLALAVLSLWIVARLSRPGMPVGRRWSALASPIVALWLAAAGVLLWAPPGERLALVLGDTWRTCPIDIALLSLPAFAAVFWALRGLAPARPAWAGAAGGLLAGALAASAYCLHCPESAVPFWAIWYVLGMGIPAALGALLGPRWLRW